MIPARLDFKIYKGSTLVKPIQWKQGDPLLPVDITGCTIQMQIRPTKNSSTVIDLLTTANSRIVIDNAITGNFSLHFPTSVTTLIADNDAVYDLEILYPGGNPSYTVIEGLIKYINEVTKL